MNRRSFLGAMGAAAIPAKRDRPNILFCLADNHSWCHIGAYGCKAVRTPTLDRVAAEGIRFTHAFCATPSCTPSRGAILTGQDTWRLGEGGNLCSTLARSFPVYPELLEQAGYHVGYTGKGYGPPLYEPALGRKRSPAGEKYQNFAEFVKARRAGQPFCFWFGGFDFDHAVRLRDGPEPPATREIRIEDVEVPPFLPDTEIVRKDFIRYFRFVEYFDAQVRRVLSDLERMGEADRTLLVVAADNGMEFPRCYPNLYDSGTREYLMARWPERIKSGRVVDDFVNLNDLAPTFLEAAGVPRPEAMTARSLMNVFESGKPGRIDPARAQVVMSRERHAWVRAGGLGYPGRAIRTHDFLYIRNYEPDRWPAGDPDLKSWPQGYYGDIDRGDTKTYMMEHHNDPSVRPLFELGFGKRPAEELYDLRKDPHQIDNVAVRGEYQRSKRDLRDRMQAYLVKTDDPRALGTKAPWDTYPYRCQKTATG